MSNFISPIPEMPQEVLHHILSFTPLSPARSARVSHQFYNIHTDLLRQNIRQIFERCSTGRTALNVFINSLKEWCQIADSQGNYPDRDAAGINKLHQLIVQKIQNFGIDCPDKYLSPQEIRGYSKDIAAIEDLNLQRAWGVIRQEIAPLNPPVENASASIIRAWMNTNAAALQHIHELYLYNRQLTCIPREIALLTGLQRLSLSYNSIRELPVGIFNGLVELQELYLHSNQIRELPVGIFNGLVGLRQLNLEGNQIRELLVGVFNGLVGLRQLNLESNQIRELLVGVFNGLVELQQLYLRDNQIRELPVEIFNGLGWLRTLSLNANPLLAFYKEPDFSSKKIFNAFHQYVCKSAFASFYQFAAQGRALEEVIAKFHTLDQTTKNAIYGMVYEEAGRPITDDLQWGEHHAFDDKWIFNGALKRYVRERFNALSESQKDAVYGLAHADPDLAYQVLRGPNWARDHAENNVLWLIDALLNS